MYSLNQIGKSTVNPSTQVFCFNWDLSNGYRKHGCGFTTGFSNIFQHVGLLAYGILYEYSEQGIIRTEIPPNEVPTSACFAGELVSCQELGKTLASKEEFECWLAEKEVAEFDGAKYHILKNNCVSFAIKACEMLQVPPSNNWVNVAKYANYIPQFSWILSSSSTILGNLFNKLKVTPQSEQITTDNKTNLHSSTEAKL